MLNGILQLADARYMAQTIGVSPSALGLRKVKLLAGLSAATLEEIAAQCRWRRYTAGQRVVSREATDHDVYMVVSGTVRITAFSGAGRQVTFRDLQAGDWFGDLAAIDGQSRSADVEALQDAVLASVSPGMFLDLLHSHTSVCQTELRRLATLVRDLSERVFDFSTLGVQNRVHAEVLRLAKEAGVKDNSARLDPAPKHADIASKVSTYRELSAMVKQGLLVRDGRSLVIPDVARLERIVAEVRRSA